MKDPRLKTPYGDEWGDVWVKGDRRLQVVAIRDHDAYVRDGEPRPIQTDGAARRGDTRYEYSHAELVAEGYSRDKTLQSKSLEELSAIREAGEHAGVVLAKRYAELAFVVERRLAAHDRFDDSELVYSRTALCPCGYGLAYPKGTSMWGSWFCSGVLTHRVASDDDAEHTVYPFSMYNIISENELANNDKVTTRGVFKPKVE